MAAITDIPDGGAAGLGDSRDGPAHRGGLVPGRRVALTLRIPDAVLLCRSCMRSFKKSTSCHRKWSISSFLIAVSTPSTDRTVIRGRATAKRFSCSSHVRMCGFLRFLLSFTKNFVKSNWLRPMYRSRSACLRICAKNRKSLFSVAPFTSSPPHVVHA